MSQKRQQSERGEDQLRDATSITLQALAQKDELEVVFRNDLSASAIQGDTVILPSVPSQKSEVAIFRGRADRHAFWLQYHDIAQRIEAQKGGENLFTYPEARALWHQLEQARVELLGGRILAGCHQNMKACLELDLEQESRTEYTGPPPIAAGALLRQALSGARFDLRTYPSKWISKLTPLIDEVAVAIETKLDDQKAFNQEVIKLLHALQLIPPEQPQENPEESPDQTPEANDQDQGGNDQTMEGSGDTATEQDPQASPEILNAASEEDAQQEATEGDQNPSWLAQELAQAGSEYIVFSRQFDQTVTPAQLQEPTELKAYRSQLDQLAQPYKALINKLALKLSRIIVAQQNRRWDYDLEEGLLDNRRLHKVIINPLAIPPHKMEQSQEFLDTTVSLLIDNSGSQRGKAIALAAITAEIVAATLERCNVKTEILGFTTSAWRGGESRKLWLQQKRPANPGRLNDLLHIVYKSATTSWRKAHGQLGLMLMPDLLKENIDGEALIWAHDRLMAQPEERRILMVISDGAPVDDSTLSANSPNYLDTHLLAVVKTIEQKSPIELVAIGIGHDVSRYYSHALTLHRAEDLGMAVIQELVTLFLKKRARH
ncbi:MAG: cobaltochelatase CobT-related protein [Gammaproteobacteria bacterium]